MASPGLTSENDDSQVNVKGRGRKSAGDSDEPFVDKKCKICGDRAVGYNFSVISCESCKAFFRRNANKEKELSCPFESKCEINSFSRRFCQFCRLKKCFEVGMKKEWILIQGSRRCKKPRLTALPERADDINKLFEEFGEGDVTVPKEMLVELVRKSANANRPNRCQCKCTCGFYPPETQLTATATPGDVPFSTNLSPNNSRLCGVSGVPSFHPLSTERPQAYWEDLRNDPILFPSCSTGFPGPPQFRSSTEDCAQASLAMTMKGLSNPEYSSPSSSVPEMQWPYPTLPMSLDDHEKFLLQELVIASNILKQPLELGLNQKAAGDLAIMDVVRITELALRRIIIMAKELSFFRNLSQDDQIALLKGSCSELMILRGVMVFNPSKDVWNHDVAQGPREMEISLDIFKRCKEAQHYDEHKRFLATFSEKWRHNENAMLLLSAITLFCPERSNLQDVPSIRKIHQRYCELLKKYLRILCSPAEAEEAYDMLLQKLVELHQLNQSLLRIYYGLNINEMDPLSQELFDLAQHR